jgi:NAD(P)-dependent dehydrogenase (short-subunit alcohol dehydrogenase family)
MRNVLITGSSGIGRACVAGFVAGGDRVWLTYRTGRERADRIVANLAAGPGRVAAFEFDQGN